MIEKYCELGPLVLTESSSLKLSDFLEVFNSIDFYHIEYDYEYIVLPPLPDKNEASTTDMTEQQIMQLKQKTYKAMVKDLVNRVMTPTY